MYISGREPGPRAERAWKACGEFMVITSGAERIAQVAARFTLDAMPGKQMAIDADLNAGLIGEEEAQ